MALQALRALGGTGSTDDVAREAGCARRPAYDRLCRARARGLVEVVGRLPVQGRAAAVWRLTPAGERWRGMTAREAALEALARLGTATAAEVAAEAGYTLRTVRPMLRRLQADGVVERMSTGTWGPARAVLLP